jgi:hypothetical protein
MNLTSSTTFSGNWKHIKGQHLALAASLALALTAVAGFAFTLDGASGPASPPNITQPAAPARVQWPQAYIYVVGSQKEAIALEMAFSEALTSGTTSDLYEVFVVDTPEAEAALQLAQRELTDAGVSSNASRIALIDTR